MKLIYVILLWLGMVIVGNGVDHLTVLTEFARTPVGPYTV